MQENGIDAAEAAVSRSYLFVPADSERKLVRAREGTADALIVDLEDAVTPEARPAARRLAAEFLAEPAAQALWVRVNPLDSPDAVLDLQHVLPAGPAGIVLPKPERAADVVELALLLAALEQQYELPQGRTRILPIVTERPAALFRLHEYAASTPRLAGLTWGAEDLSAVVGATASRDSEGNWFPPYELARSLCLFAAAAAEVAAIDTVFTDFRNEAALAAYAGRARRDGFEGMLAIHPAQVDIINEAFMPSPGEVSRAREIVQLFAANPGAGTLGMNGEMIDRPHWLQARRILEMVARLEGTSQPESEEKKP